MCQFKHVSNFRVVRVEGSPGILFAFVNSKEKKFCASNMNC